MRTIDDMVRMEVHYCVSALVSTLAQGGQNFAVVQGANDLGALCDQAFELCTPIDDWEEAAIQQGWHQAPNGRWWREGNSEDDPSLLETFLGSGPYIWADTAASACTFVDDIEPYQREIFEHWLVSEWLADRLEAAGERVDKDFAGLVIWARTTTGQGIASDGVIERIYAETHKP